MSNTTIIPVDYKDTIHYIKVYNDSDKIEFKQDEPLEIKETIALLKYVTKFITENKKEILKKHRRLT